MSRSDQQTPKPEAERNVCTNSMRNENNMHIAHKEYLVWKDFRERYLHILLWDSGSELSAHRTLDRTRFLSQWFC